MMRPEATKPRWLKWLGFNRAVVRPKEVYYLAACADKDRRRYNTLPMNKSIFNRVALSGCLTLLFVAGTCHAELYKWVDANGRTHYSERKDDSGKAKALALKTAPQTTSTQATNSPTEYWQDQERQFKQRQIQKPNEKLQEAPTNKTPKSLSGGREDGTDASRCNLAQDIISGAVKHGNGKPADKYDREVAESDVRAFCH